MNYKLYSTDKTTAASAWIRKEVKGKKTFDAPQLSSGCNIKQLGRGRLVDNALGYMVTGGNNVYFNDTNVSMFSGAFSGAHGLSVIPKNFMKVVALFTARRCITGKYHTWINDKDEYLPPSEVL